MRSAHPHASRAHERALTLIEVVIVLAIIAVLLAAAVWSTRSARTSSGRAASVAAARAIGDAVDDFRKDHAGRPPALGTARDWPTPTGRGPRNSYSGTWYLRGGEPDAITGGLARLSTGTASTRFTLRYSTSARGWRITVIDRTGATPPCHVSGGTPPAAVSGSRPC